MFLSSALFRVPVHFQHFLVDWFWNNRRLIRSVFSGLLLDRHQVWRSHDPTSVRLFTFVNKRCHTPFFVFHLFCTNSAQLGSFGSTPLNSAQFCSLRSTFKKDSFASIAFTFFKKMQLYHLIILLLVILLPVICPVIWCFPIWLTSSLSYPMAIFSVNEIWTFFYIWTISGKSELRLLVSSAMGGLSIHYFWLFLLPLWYTKKPRVAFECKVCVTPNRRRRNCTVRIFWGNTTRYIGGKLKPWRIATQKRPYKKLLIPA